MASGIHAAAVPCIKCAGRADRTSEGQENDYYRCSECGSEFGIDWSYDGPPQSPCWPISEEEAAERRRLAGELARRSSAAVSRPARAETGEGREQLEAEYRDVVRRAMPRPHAAVDYLLRADYIAEQTDEQLRDFIRDFSRLAAEQDEIERLTQGAIERVLANVPAVVDEAFRKMRAEEGGGAPQPAPPDGPTQSD